MAGEVTLVEGNRQAFKAATSWAPGAAATDTFTITGAPQRIIRILKIKLSGIATAAIITPVDLIRRTTANSAGTAVTVGSVCTDAKNTNPSKALVQKYTAPPTTGSVTNGGTLEIVRLPLATTANAVPGGVYEFDFTTAGSTPITLRTELDVLAINLEGVTIAGLNLSACIEYIEEEINF